MPSASTPEKVVFDFSQQSCGSWQIVNDDVMGGVSTSRFEVRGAVAHFFGQLSPENSGGFASFRSAPGDLGLVRCQTLLAKVKGDGRTYKLTVRTEPGFDTALYQLPFTTTPGVWRTHRFPLGQFTPTFRGRVLDGYPPIDPEKIASIGMLISDKQFGPFHIEIASIKAM